jgi:hypothetical protein
MIVEKQNAPNQQEGGQDEQDPDSAEDRFGAPSRWLRPLRDRVVIVVGWYGRGTQNAWPNVMKS